MKRAGIICECNPFHGGHEYLIRQAREGGAEAVVCVMSGCFVQRGEPAAADPFLRAKALLSGGADLVLELPFPYAAAGAEFFARAGVNMLSRLGVDQLWFGSECGDLSLLRRAAAVCESPAFGQAYQARIGEKNGTASAYLDLISEALGENVTLSSNDILGVAYLRAILGEQSGMEPVTVKRQGSAYLNASLDEGEFPSATALRKLWREAGAEAILPHLPTCCAEIYRSAPAPADLKYAERWILGHFRLADPASLQQIAELEGGLGNRLCKAARKASNLEELLELTSTKKYTLSRIRRGILFAMLGVTADDLRTPPAYGRLLGANDTGKALLAACKKQRDLVDPLPIVTKQSDIPATPEARRQNAFSQRAAALYTLCLSDALTVEEYLRAQKPSLT